MNERYAKLRRIVRQLRLYGLSELQIEVIAKLDAEKANTIRGFNHSMEKRDTRCLNL